MKSFPLRARALLADTLQVRQRHFDLAYAARCTIGVAVPLILAVALGYQSYAVYLCIGALVAGMASKRGVYRTRIATMLGIAICLAFATAIGAVTSGQLYAELVVFAVFGYLVGLVSSLGAIADYVGTHVLVALAIFSIQPLPPSQAVIAGVLAFSGALFQTLLCAFALAYQGGTQEDSALADAYDELGEYAGRLATRQTVAPAVVALATLRGVLADMRRFADDESVAARQSLADLAERLRINLATVTTFWSAPGTALESDVERERQALADTSATILRGIAEALRTRTEPRVTPDIWGDFDAACVSLSLPALAANIRIAWRLCQGAWIPGGAQIAWANALEPIYAAPALIARSMVGAFSIVRSNLSWESPYSRHGMRLAAVLIIAVLLGRWLDFNHFYWIAITVAFVLKPDFNTTFSRGIARVIGTLLGATMAGLVLVGHPAIPALVAACVLFAALSYLISNVNYAVAMTVVCAFVLCLIALNAPNNDAAIAARIGATFIGSALAMIAYLAWPTWERNITPQRLTEVLTCQQEFTAVVFRGYLKRGNFSVADLQTAQRACWKAHDAFVASMQRLGNDPVGPRLLSLRSLRAIASANERYRLSVLALGWNIPDDRQLPPVCVAPLEAVASAIDETFRAIKLAIATNHPPAAPTPLFERHRALVASCARSDATFEFVCTETDGMIKSLHDVLDLVAAAVSPGQSGGCCDKGDRT